MAHELWLAKALSVRIGVVPPSDLYSFQLGLRHELVRLKGESEDSSLGPTASVARAAPPKRTEADLVPVHSLLRPTRPSLDT